MDLANQIDSAIAVLHTSVGHMHGQQVPAAIHQDVALAAIYLLGRVVPAWPTGAITLTVWLSTIPSVGLGSRPWSSRTNISSA